MSRPLLPVRGGRRFVWLGSAAVTLLIFVRVTRELIEGDVSAMDRAILLAVTKSRSPWLTSMAIDVTALGSITLVILFSAFTLAVLLILSDHLGALQLLAASAGAGVLTLVTKNFIERIRPDETQQLVAVSGFSYPSGHSVATSTLYLTIAILAVRYTQHSGLRTTLFLAASTVIIMVGASRVYLGVHYATDVVSGISLGAAWALLLTGLFRLGGHRGTS